jgi:hypothetical protein
MKTYAFGLVFLLSVPVGADTIDAPWAVVPALPGACYTEQDHLSETAAAALETLDEDISAQNAINDEISGQVGDMANADPFAMAQRMQDYMMNNPEAATQMLEGLQTTGQTSADLLAGESEWEIERGGELDDLITRYRAAFAEMRAPIDSQIAALPTEPTEAGAVFTDEAIAQLPAINRQASAAYERLCAEWWQPGPFATWLKEYRRYLTDERAPRERDLSDKSKQQFDIQGVDTSGYRSTAEMDAARDYLQKMQRIYAERLQKPTDIHVIP